MPAINDTKREDELSESPLTTAPADEEEEEGAVLNFEVDEDAVVLVSSAWTVESP